MHRFARATEFDNVDLIQLRDRLQRMTLDQLVRFGKAARDMCRPTFGQPPRQTFLIQLRESREECRRRKAANQF